MNSPLQRIAFRFVMILLIIVIITVFLSEISEIEEKMIVIARIVSILGGSAATILAIIMLWPWYRRIFFIMSWPWGLLGGTITLLVFTVAKVIADHAIITITHMPVTYFSRSQDVFTTILTITLWLLTVSWLPMLVLVMVQVLMIVNIIIYFLLYARTFVLFLVVLVFMITLRYLLANELYYFIAVVSFFSISAVSAAIFHFTPGKLSSWLKKVKFLFRSGEDLKQLLNSLSKAYTWISSEPIGSTMWRMTGVMFSSWLFLIIIAAEWGRFINSAAVNILLVSSFVRNDERPFEFLFAVSERKNMCEGYSSKTLINFVDEKKIIIAIPVDGRSKTDRKFRFVFSVCQRSSNLQQSPET